MNVKRIGIVLETRDDAIATGNQDLNRFYHWREPEEIAALIDAIQSLGFETLMLGTPAKACSEAGTLKQRVDFIFNLSVGFQSRFRLALGPALYELSGVPYSGADPYTKMISQNKQIMKPFWDKLGIPNPEWVYIHRADDIEKAAFPKFPLIIKPAYEGSSIGVPAEAVVYNRTDLEERVRRLFDDLKMPVLVERFITGKEYKVGVIGDGEIQFLGMLEDVCDGKPMDDKFLYFQAKTAGSFGKEKRDISLPEFLRIKRDCLKIYNLFTPVDYGTFDIRVDADGKHYYFLEFNADATLHPRRTLAECCRLNGVEYREMITGILKSAFQRWRIPWN